MSFLLLKQRKEKKKREAKKKVCQIWFTFFLLNECLLMIFFMVKFWILLYATKYLFFFQKFTWTQKSNPFLSGRNTKLRGWPLVNPFLCRLQNRSWFKPVMWSRSQIGCKANERKTFVIVIISTYKWAGITAGKNVTLPNLIVIKHRHSQNPIERIAVSNKAPVSGLLYRRDS